MNQAMFLCYSNVSEVCACSLVSLLQSVKKEMPEVNFSSNSKGHSVFINLMTCV